MHDTHTGNEQRTLVSTPLNLKALRLAVHGWWLGNPLVYKPGVRDLSTVARALSDAGAASGTLIVSDAPPGSRRLADGARSLGAGRADARVTVHALVLLRPPIPRAVLGPAAAQTVAKLAQAALGRPCIARGRWHVELSDAGGETVRLCRVTVENHKDVAFLGLRFAFGSFCQVTRDATGQPLQVLVARPDWREVFLARVLHALDARLRTLQVA